MDVSQYLGVFLDEAKEHLQTLNDSIMQLEQDPNNEDCINEIFRAAHSMKGMAGTMGYKRMQQLTHDIEDVFSDIRNGTLKVNGNIIDTLFQCLDAVQAYVDNIGQTQDEGTEDNAHLIQALANIRAGGAGVDEQKTENAPAANENVQETVHTADAAVAYQEIRIDPDMKAKLEGDLSDGKKVYGITVHIMESCVLKAARAFLVLKGLEEIGEIALCEPSMQDIEDEKFDTTFSLLLVTEDTIDHVRTIAEEVSEIQKVDVGDYDVKNSKNSEDDSHAPAPAAQASKQAANVPVPQPKSPAADRNTPPVKKPAGKSGVSRTIRVDIEKLDSMMNLVSELIIAKNSLISTTQSEELSNNAVNERIEYLESVTTNLHESVMKVRMVPIENALQKFPRMIRDLNKSLGKKMELTMTGEDTEMDRTVVDEIGDPLMHLLRNSADHGIETPDVRISRGKPEVGQIFLHAYQDGNSVVIEVGDDGNGIDADVVKAKAIEKGVVTPEQAEALTEQQCVELLFHPGFSTAKNVS
ncbi:MAG: chemotaxis protein CheA, partial [Lachnospiraceae bacterium]|nr:chemotaxis protein CheA [Lachnospiraceae bacterium]